MTHEDLKSFVLNLVNDAMDKTFQKINQGDVPAICDTPEVKHWLCMQFLDSWNYLDPFTNEFDFESDDDFPCLDAIDAQIKEAQWESF